MDNNQLEGVTGFSQRINVDKVKSKGLREKVEADNDQCQVLKEQLALHDLKALAFNCLIKPWKKGGVAVSGEVSATIVEICVVTLEPFTTEIKEQVERYFERPRGDKAETAMLELDDLDDELPDVIDNAQIDIGAIALETLALCLSPHPRKPGVVFEDHIESDPNSADDPARENPFDVLQQLKKH